MRYAFIEQLGDSYPLQMRCAALQVSDSGFTSWQRSDGPKKWLSDSALLKRIREIHEETKAAYGSPRIYQELKGLGIPVSKGRVERLMRENDLRGRHKRRFKATTDSKHTLQVAPNRLEQNFATERPDQVWTADITYIATAEGWLYLAIVLDLYTRQIVGWAMRERMTKELVIDALRARGRRIPDAVDGLAGLATRDSRRARSRSAQSRLPSLRRSSRTGSPPHRVAPHAHRTAPHRTACEFSRNTDQVSGGLIT